MKLLFKTAGLVCLAIFSFHFARAYQVTGLTASYKNGQVFLTWTNPTPTNLKYKVYRSTTKFTSSTQLSTANYLGYVRDNSGKNLRKTDIKNTDVYFTIDATAGPLSSSKGLYVVTCTDNGNWFYAVMVEDLSTAIEDKTISLGGNSLNSSVAETVAAIQPVLQATVNDNSGDVNYEYVVWGNNQHTSSLPAFTNCGSYGYNFTYIHHTSSTVPLYILFKDSDPFSHINSPVSIGECNLLVMDDWLPNNEYTYWFGYHENYDIYSTTNSTSWTTGTVRAYTHHRTKWTLDWIVANKPVDATRVYAAGTSHNGFGAMLTAMLIPEKIAAQWGTVPPPLVKALAGSTREKMWCASSANLPTDILHPDTGLPINMWDVFDFRKMYRINNLRGIPYIGGVHGKKDTKIGWVGLVYWYDSVNVSHQGGIWFWDQRTHSGSGKNFTDEEASIDYTRFSTQTSYPAFSYCSINQNWGGTNPNAGAPYGAINGYLDWDDNSIVDQACNYSITCKVVDLYVNGVLQTQYDTCTADVTLRRLQNFIPEIGQTITWTNTSSNNNVIQSGSFVYNGGPITINDLKIKRTGSTLSVVVSTSQLTTYYADADGDGFGNLAVSTQACIQPAGYVLNNTDCNDGHALINPSVNEVCNSLDDNCSGQADEGVQTLYYADADGDGFGNVSVSLEACALPAGYCLNGDDCDDTNALIKPGVLEIVNGVDDNCNGQVDDLVLILFYEDADGDGYGNAAVSVLDFFPPPGFVMNDDDCNDGNETIYPSAAETCNEMDDNCSGQADEGVQLVYYADADGDGFGNPGQPTQACSAPLGYVADHADCNDGSAEVKPGATEVCNNVDDNCSGQIDEGVKTTYYADTDGDGYGNVASTTQACSLPLGYVSNSSDCNDASFSIKPGATETCNSIDDNCNGQVDDGVVSSTITPSGTVNFCDGNSTVLQANTGSGLTYQWKKDGNNISGGTNSSYTATSSASYTVVVTKSSCSATSVATIGNEVVLPTPTIATSSGTTTFCSNSGVYLTTPLAGYAYTWLKGVTVQSGATGQTFVPPSSGSYKLRITDANGCTKTSSSISVTVNTAPSPTISGNAAICGSQATTLSSGATYSSYLWSTGATTSSINVSTAGSYSLSVTDNNGCTGTSAAVATSVFPAPTPTISASGPVEFCDGGSVTLNVNQSYNSYSWSNNKFTQSQTISASGTFNCTVTDANGCVGTSNSISVNEHIIPASTAVSSTGGTTWCSNAGVYLTTSVSGYNYQWLKGSTIQSGATNQNFFPSSSGTYKVQLSDALGCTKNSGTISITINTAPAPTITGNPSICGATAATLSANTNYSGYAWSNGASTKTITTSSAGTYTLTVTDANGCTGTSPSVTTAVYSLPVATISASPGLEFCDGSSITLSAASSSEYSWSTGKTTQTITVTSSGNYSVTITDSHGCTASASVTANEHILPVPVVTAVGPTTYCIGDAASYLTTSSNGYLYKWKKGTAYVDGATSQNFQPAGSGTYKVEIADNIGCTKLASTGVNVTANAVPTVSISATGSLNICNGETKSISSSVTGMGITYQWKKNNVNISGATTSGYTASAAGTYTCLVTNNKGCTAVSNSIEITSNCRVNDGEQTGTIRTAEIKLYPNPATHIIHIEAGFYSEIQGEVLLELRNSLGMIVYSERKWTEDGRYTTTMQLDQRISSGAWIATICLNNECVTKQFIVAGDGR